MESLLVACDFDGTITERDTLHVIVEEFGADGVWAELEPRLRSGELSVIEAMRIQFSQVRATEEEVLAAVEAATVIRAGFDALRQWCRDSGHELVVFSAGFRGVIADVLTRAGHGDLDVISNDARFSRDGCRLSWDLPGGECEWCGRPCKRMAVEERRAGRRLVFIGDGASDHCAAQTAEVIFARASLAEHLTALGREFTLYRDFHEVVRQLTLPRAA